MITKLPLSGTRNVLQALVLMQQDKSFFTANAISATQQHCHKYYYYITIIHIISITAAASPTPPPPAHPTHATLGRMSACWSGLGPLGASRRTSKWSPVWRLAAATAQRTVKRSASEGTGQIWCAAAGGRLPLGGRFPAVNGRLHGNRCPHPGHPRGPCLHVQDQEDVGGPCAKLAGKL